MKKEILLGNKNYFEIFIGKRILKKEIFQSKNTIPIYSANVNKPFGFTKKSNISDFSYDSILWGIDGNFELNLIKKGEVFATTDHCGVIKILNKKIIPEYILYQLRLKSTILGFDRTLRSSLTNMKEVSIEIPITSTGDFDETLQYNLSKKYKRLWEITNILKDKVEELRGISVEIPLSNSVIPKRVDDLFNFPETNSGITKDYCEKHSGDIPVYASSKNKENVLGYIKDNIDSIKYYPPSLTWNRNGSVGKVFLRNTKFSTNEDHRVLFLNKKYSKQIDIGYIKYILENEIKKMGFSFTNKLGVNRISTIEIPVPLNKEKISLEEQERIKKLYEDITRIKEKLMSSLEELKEIKIEIN